MTAINGVNGIRTSAGLIQTLASLGDVNGDGRDDVIVGSLFTDNGHQDGTAKILLDAGGRGTDVASFKGYEAADPTITTDAATSTTQLVFSSGQTADISGHVIVVIGDQTFLSA